MASLKNDQDRCNRTSDIVFLFQTFFFPVQPGAYITHNATWLVCSLEFMERLGHAPSGGLHGTLFKKKNIQATVVRSDRQIFFRILNCATNHT